MARPQSKISDRKAAALTEAWNSGATLDEIAARLGLSRSQVYRRRRQLGLPARKLGNDHGRPPFDELRIYLRGDDHEALNSHCRKRGISTSRYFRELMLADLERSAG